MSDFASRLKEIREDLGLSVVEITEKIDYNVSNYRKVEKGQFLLPTEKQGVLCTLYGISLSWLIAGIGPRYVDGSFSKQEQIPETALPVVTEAPTAYAPGPTPNLTQAERLERAKKALEELSIFYAEPGAPNVFDLETPAAAGRAITLLEEDKTKLKPNLYLPGLGPGIHIRMPVSGNSMHPTIRDEDRVVGTWVPDGWKAIKKDRVYIVLDMDDDVVVKRLAPVSKTQIRLVSDNPLVLPYLVHLDAIRAVFRVQQIHREDLRKDDSPDAIAEIVKLRQEWSDFKASFPIRIEEIQLQTKTT